MGTPFMRPATSDSGTYTTLGNESETITPDSPRPGRAHGSRAKTQRGQPVKGCRAAAAQQMPQHHDPGILAGAAGQRLRHLLAHAPRRSTCPAPADASTALAIARIGALGHDHKGI